MTKRIELSIAHPRDYSYWIDATQTHITQEQTGISYSIPNTIFNKSSITLIDVSNWIRVNVERLPILVEEETHNEIRVPIDLDTAFETTKDQFGFSPLFDPVQTVSGSNGQFHILNVNRDTGSLNISKHKYHEQIKVRDVTSAELKYIDMLRVENIDRSKIKHSIIETIKKLSSENKRGPTYTLFASADTIHEYCEFFGGELEINCNPVATYKTDNYRYVGSLVQGTNIFPIYIMNHLGFGEILVQYKVYSTPIDTASALVYNSKSERCALYVNRENINCYARKLIIS